MSKLLQLNADDLQREAYYAGFQTCLSYKKLQAPNPIYSITKYSFYTQDWHNGYNDCYSGKTLQGGGKSRKRRTRKSKRRKSYKRRR